MLGDGGKNMNEGDQEREMEKKMSLKLLVDKNAHKVLFAEAGKDFVDVLFSFLALPLGSAIRLLSKHRFNGSITRLYESMDNLSQTYLRQGLDKNSLLNLLVTPSLPSPSSPQMPPLLLLHGDGAKTAPETRYYTCGGHPGHIKFPSSEMTRCFTTVKGTVCPRSSRPMEEEMKYVAPSDGARGEAWSGDNERGYVKGVVTYMVTDDLGVTPMSTISCIALLNRLNVKEVGAVEEKVVQVGVEEALSLLKASLQSKTALTDVFVK